MSVIGASLVVAGFAVLAHYIGLLRWTGEVMGHVKKSMSVLKDSQLDDYAKEKALKSSSIKLFRLLGLLIVGSATAVLAPVGLVWLLDAIDLMSLDEVMDMLMRWDFLMTATIVGLLTFFMLRKLRK